MDVTLYTDITDITDAPDATVLPSLDEWQAFCAERADMQKQIAAYENIAIAALDMSDAYNDLLENFGIKEAQSVISAKMLENAEIARLQNKMRSKMGREPDVVPESLSKAFYLKLFTEFAVNLTEKITDSKAFIDDLFHKYEPAIVSFSDAIVAVNDLDFVKNRLIPDALNTSMAKEVQAQIIKID
jgi:hypothetical protein